MAAQEEGGWALVYNSVLGPNTTDFWHIPYAERLTRRGRPSLDSNFYDGHLYIHGTMYMDVVEDLHGKTAILFVARAEGFDTNTMRFKNPQKLSGREDVYSQQFALGWSAPDYDGDTYSEQCSLRYLNVTQHYGTCFYYSLGASDDVPYEDNRTGPHLYSTIASVLGLATDNAPVTTRVRRISRYAKW